MRFRLRTLLIVLAVLPPILAPVFVWSWHRYRAWQSTSSVRSGIPGYLGAELDDNSPLGTGVIVKFIRRGSPADNAGLLAGDVIIRANRKRCRDLNDYDANAVLAPGSSLVLVVTRNGAQKSLTAKLGKRSGSQPPPAIVVPTASPADVPTELPADSVETGPATIEVSAEELLERNRRLREQIPPSKSQEIMSKLPPVTES